MTEAEWLACGDPDKLLAFIGRKADERRLRLFAIACVRRVLHLLTDERSWDAVLFAQAHDDDPTQMVGRATAHDAAMQVAMDISRRQGAQFFASPANPRYRGEWTHIRAANAAALLLADTASRAARMGSINAAIALQLDCAWESPKEERAHQAGMFRDIFGNPFHPVPFDTECLTWDAVLLATGIYDDRAFDRMPILADALQDADCTNEDILNHCRDPKQIHVRGCWVVDLVIGKE